MAVSPSNADALKLITGDRAGAIAASIEAAIERDQLAAGASLPTVRRLAGHLRVSPTTVAAAYRDLQARGLLISSGRRGTRVAARLPVSHRAPDLVPPDARDLAHRGPVEPLTGEDPAGRCQDLCPPPIDPLLCAH